MTRHTTRALRLLVLPAALGATVLGGCGSKPAPDDVSFRAINKNPTPELRTLTYRGVDYRRNFTVANNQNKRAMYDDLSRMFLYDQSTRLTPLPIADTSGQPR